MYPTVWLLILVQFTFIVSEENVIIDDNTEAKDEFCMPGRRLNSFYWTGSNFKGIIRDDDHGGIFSWSAGTSSARIRAFHFKYNPNNGYFDRFKVFHESTDQPSFTNCTYLQTTGRPSCFTSFLSSFGYFHLQTFPLPACTLTFTIPR